jgi:hypothetical protein
MKKILNNLLYIIFLIIITILLFSSIFTIAPTKAEVEDFLRYERTFTILTSYYCDPYAIETNSDSEYPCAYYLRKNSALMFGQIFNKGFPFNGNNPFGYFSYDLTYNEFGCASTNSCNYDEHSYVFVMTRDEGVLVYNPMNGKFIGSYNNLMTQMGCNFQPSKKEFFFSQQEKLNLDLNNGDCYMDNLLQGIE